jgi:hypothetical protein
MTPGLLEQLPGARRYLDTVATSLRNGRSVLVTLPEHGPEALRHAVNGRVANDGTRSWRSIDLSDSTLSAGKPAEIVAQHCVPGPRTARELSEHEDFSGMVIWVDGIPDARWSAWRDFLEDYAELSRSQTEHERAVFCVPVIGERTALVPKEDVTCAVHPWRGVLGRLDILWLIASLLPTGVSTRLHAELWVSVATELAGTDVALAARLASADLATVLDPRPLLEAWARERGFRADGKPSWARGEEDLRDGAPFVHSARALLSHRGAQEIQRRVWRGQVGVLFPFLEEQRALLLSKLSRVVRVPHVTPFGTINDPRDLELSHLAHFARKAHAAQTLRDHLERLTAMRHRLAHLEAVPYELLATLED